jgi:hypothetical protein
MSKESTQYATRAVSYVLSFILDRFTHHHLGLFYEPTATSLLSFKHFPDDDRFPRRKGTPYNGLVLTELH